MATSERNETRRAGPAPAANRKATSAPTRPADDRRVIQAPTAPSDLDGMSIFGAIFAAFVSLAAHVLLVLLIWSIPVDSQANAALNIKKKDDALAVKANDQEKKDEEKEEKLPDLTNTDIGNKDLTDTEASLPIERLTEAEVAPGPVNVDQTVGVDTPLQNDAKVMIAPKGLPGGDPTGLSIGVKGENGVGLAGGDPGTGPGGFKDGFGTAFQNPFSGRSGGTKEKLLREGGGNDASEAAVASGLLWLARHQSQDGHWSLNGFNRMGRDKPYPAGKTIAYDYGRDMGLGSHGDDVAATALALLPFLAAGQTHQASKDPNQKVHYHKGILQGLDWLVKQQKPNGQMSHNFYAHGIASIALCEAYGLTSDPKLKVPAQKALDYIVATQNDAGGWRYAPKEAGDLSVSGWQLMALKSGQMSGLRVPSLTLKGAEHFVDSCEAGDTGTYTYLPGGTTTASMTATGMLCRQYLGVNPRNPKLGKGVNFLKKPENSPTSADLYYLYYATQVMHHMGGESWAYWNEGPNKNDGIRDTLIRLQDKSPEDGRTAMLRGSWYYPSGHTAAGGRLMSTSLCLLCLEVYYRHLPLYRGEVTEMKPMN